MRLTLAALLLLPMPAAAHGVPSSSGWPGAAVAIMLAAVAAAYVAGIAAGAPVPLRRQAAFAAGWIALAGALAPPLDTAAAGSFAIHMLQHELVMVVAPPLLILGQPFAAWAAVAPRAAVAALAWPLRIPPPAAWGLHAVALWAWHAPRLFDAAVGSPSVHALQHASFFVTALLFWWTVFRRVRAATAAIYVVTTIIHTGALAALLTFAPFALYAGTALESQQLGGLIMWVPAGYALVLAGMIACNRLLEAHA
jgi:cytochrome c oxidase assembly factor CtaG